MKMRKKLSRTVCLLVAVIMMVAMSTTTADAASFSKAAPKGLKATCTSGVSIKVTCKKKKGANGYYFYYATKKGGKYKLGVKSTSRTGTIKGLTPGKTYYFKVKAYKGKVLKKFTKMSKPAKCKAVLKAPGVAFKDRCCCRIAIKLSGSVGAKGYKIYRSTSKTGGFVKVGTTSEKVWFDEGPSGKEDPELMPSTTYYYKVRGYYGSYYSPYSSVLTVKTLAQIDGNISKYNPAGSEALVPLPDQHSKLENRKLLFLGSSITYGSATGGISFADYISKRDGATVKKLAVSGTNMAWKTKTDASYVNRLMKNNPASFIPDIFACQLSLNDSLNGIALGSLPDINFDELDESKVEALYEKSNTVGGAIGYIAAYANYNWEDCQIVFYTVRNNGYNNQYTKMRAMLYDAKKKYGNFEIIDMWKISDLTNLKGNLKQFCLYMDDNNHPNKAGYLYQWTPEFEKAFINWMPENPDYYTVTWKNADGTVVLETDTNARKGEIPSYNGQKPTKAEDDQYTYVFEGWSEQPNTESGVPAASLPKVTEDVTYYAAFRKVEKVAEPEQPDQPGQSDQQGEQVDPGDSGGGNDSGGQKQNGEPTDGDTNGGDGGSDGNGGSDGGSDGNGGGSESNDDITSVILSLFRAA